MPYRSCWQVCLHAKARSNYHKQQYDRRPLVHSDHGFILGK